MKRSSSDTATAAIVPPASRRQRNTTTSAPGDNPQVAHQGFLSKTRQRELITYAYDADTIAGHGGNAFSNTIASIGQHGVLSSISPSSSNNAAMTFVQTMTKIIASGMNANAKRRAAIQSNAMTVEVEKELQLAKTTRANAACEAIIEYMIAMIRQRQFTVASSPEENEKLKSMLCDDLVKFQFSNRKNIGGEERNRKYKRQLRTISDMEQMQYNQILSVFDTRPLQYRKGITTIPSFLTGTCSPFPFPYYSLVSTFTCKRLRAILQDQPHAVSETASVGTIVAAEAESDGDETVIILATPPPATPLTSPPSPPRTVTPPPPQSLPGTPVSSIFLTPIRRLFSPFSNPTLTPQSSNNLSVGSSPPPVIPATPPPRTPPSPFTRVFELATDDEEDNNNGGGEEYNVGYFNDTSSFDEHVIPAAIHALENDISSCYASITPTDAERKILEYLIWVPNETQAHELLKCETVSEYLSMAFAFVQLDMQQLCLTLLQ
jgi:hypothetical protein